MTEAQSVTNLLDRAAAEWAADKDFVFLSDGESREHRSSACDMRNAALRVAARIREEVEPRERVVLLMPPGLGFVQAFFGVLYAGAIAVPLAPPDPTRLDVTMPRFLAIVQDAQPSVVVTTREWLGLKDNAAALLQGLDGLTWRALEDLIADGPMASPAGEDGQAVCYLQYTSGSTALPKGVEITHANVLSNVSAVRRFVTTDDPSRKLTSVSWLPHFHDMGLVGGLLAPMYFGAGVVLLSPLHFLQDPLRWVRAISRYRAYFSGAPTFAYDLVARRARPDALRGVDLSPWDVAFCGSEPIRSSVVEGFQRAFGPYGLKETAFRPGYGLAEATLFVTASPPVRPTLRSFDRTHLTRGRAERTRGDAGLTLAGCGFPVTDEIQIVDPESRVPVSPREIGEVWLSGPSVARGYWRRRELTKDVFGCYLADGEGPFLRTGDVGFVDGEQLYVTGRMKDVIIVRGRNHFPDDIESTMVSADPAARPGGAVAFQAVVDDVERLVLIQEVRDPNEAVAERMGARLFHAVAHAHGVLPHEVAIIPRGGLLKTTSGKVQRAAMRQRWLDGGLTPLTVFSADEREGVGMAERRGLRKTLAEIWCTVLGQDEPAAIRDDDDFVLCGGSSVSMVQMSHEIERRLGRRISVADLYAHRKFDELARRLERSTIPPPAIVDYAREARMPDDIAPAGPSHGHPEVALLTGATGLVGSFVLEELLRSTPLHVRCLVRASSPSAARLRLKEACRRHGVSACNRDDWERRTSVVVGDLALPRLGLAPSALAQLAKDVDVIYHVAAEVDWVKPYEMLRASNVDGTRRIFSLACDTKSKPVHYCSTFNVVSFEADGGILFENDPVPTENAVASGYMQSKRVAEQMAHEMRRRGLPVTIYRTDFIAGGPSGALDRNTFLARFLQTATTVRELPMHATHVDVLPADYVAEAIVRLAGMPDTSGKTFHLINRRPLTLDALAVRLQARGYELRRFPWAAFKARVRGDSSHPLFALTPFLDSIETEHLDQIERLIVDDAETVSRLCRSDPTWIERVPRAETIIDRTLDFLLEAGHVEPPGDELITLDVSSEPASLLRRRIVRGASARQTPRTTPAFLRGGAVPHELRSVHRQNAKACDASLQELGRNLIGALASRLVQMHDTLTSPLEVLVQGGEQRRHWTLSAPAGTRADALLVDFDETCQLAHVLPCCDVLVQLDDDPPDAPIEVPAMVPLSVTLRAQETTVTAWWSTARQLSEEAWQRWEGLLGDGWARAQSAVVADHHPPVAPPASGAAVERCASVIPLLRAAFDQHRSNIALRHGERELSYGQLHEQAGAVATWAAAHRARPIGVLCDDPMRTVVAMVGILLGGGTLVPLGPYHPDEHLRQIMSAAKLEHVIVAGQMPRSPRQLGDATLHDVPSSSVEGAAPHRPAVEDAAYVIFTSGSTGRPRGAVNTHRGLRSVVLDHVKRFDLGPSSRLLQVVAFTFDPAMVNVFGALVSGATLLLRDHHDATGTEALQALVSERISHLCAPVAMMRTLPPAALPDLRVIWVGGETCPPALAQRWSEGRSFHNCYGLSEAAVCSLTCTYDGERELVPLRETVAGSTVMLLDDQLKPTTIGRIGELYIAGDGVGRGYIADPRATAEAWIPNPCGAPGSRMIRTGDRGRVNIAGEVEIVGRIDDQVKVQGERISLNQVRQVLLRRPGIDGAYVGLFPDGRGQVLVAFAVAGSERNLTDEELAAHAARALPGAAVPTVCLVVSELPLTANGKVDKAALADLLRERSSPRSAHSPTTALEQAVVDTLRAVLDDESLSTTDDFFEYGGTSMLAAQCTVLFRELFHVTVPLASFFEARRATELAALIRRQAEPGSRAERLAAQAPDAAPDAPTIARRVHTLWGNTYETIQQAARGMT